ncbi:MAG: hypothetical protein WCL21_07370 [Mariniphaga sp.]
MKQLIILLILSVTVAACGLNHQKPEKSLIKGIETVQPETKEPTSLKTDQPDELGMWKIASYAVDLGDNKNSFYITNEYAIWGKYSNNTVDNDELKVKFVIDKVSFCIKLYEYGKKIVKKGDENSYKITIKSNGIESYQITARNATDRIFIQEADARKIIELFNRGIPVSFSLLSDSKTNPSTYTFGLEHPEGINTAFKKITN